MKTRTLLEEWLVPSLFGVLFGVTAGGVLIPNRTTTLTLVSLLFRAVNLLFTAVLSAIAGTFAGHRLCSKHRDGPGRRLILSAWGIATWIPVLLLTWMQRPLLCALTLMPITLIAVRASKHQFAFLRQTQAVDRLAHQPQGSWPDHLACFVQVQPLALVSALLLATTLVALMAAKASTVALLVVLTTACLTWAFTSEDFERDSISIKHLAQLTFLSFVTTCLALAPSLRAGSLAAQVGDANKQMVRGTPGPKQFGFQAHTTVVLLAPPLPKLRRVIAPPKGTSSAPMHPVRPLNIPFDGSYSFALEDQVGQGAQRLIEHGDPIKRQIRSSDRTPLRMTAHQELSVRLNSACCSTFEVHLHNADERSGITKIEVHLRDVRRPSNELVLSAVPVLSSPSDETSTTGTGSRETLRFRFPATKGGYEFDEIELRFLLAPSHRLISARMKVDGFTLVP